MSRSLKKGPYINIKLEKKVIEMNESGKKAVVKTWARASCLISWATRLPTQRKQVHTGVHYRKHGRA